MAKNKKSQSEKKLERPSSAEKSKRIIVGGLEADFDQGAISAIRYNGIEILRGIAYLIRDANWGTYNATLLRQKTLKTAHKTHITYDAIAGSGEARIRYAAEIVVTKQSLSFAVTATPDHDFKTNRTGFVILHAADVAGRPLTISHVDGTSEKSKFPKLISPGQPFFDVRAMEHSPAPGLKVHVLMEGPKFETEDQRNWTDASFKTYVCSLLDPWPYVLKGGESFTQKITVTVRGKAAAAKKSRSVPKLEFQKSAVTMPEIGIAIPADQVSHSLAAIDHLQKLAPKHLVFTIDGTRDIASVCSTYSNFQKAASLPVTAEIILPAIKSADDEMTGVVTAMHSAGLSPSRVMVTQIHDMKSFQPGDKRPWGPGFEELAAAARKHFPAAMIGGGMLSFFTELNRKQPPKGVFDFITHSICPIVHDASDAAVMQTLESLPHVFGSGKAMIGKTPYHLGPSSIGARLNPYGASLTPNPDTKRVCLAPNDPRQTEQFAVGWNLGVLVAAARSGLASVTLSDLTGPRGLVDGKGVSTPLFKAMSQWAKVSGQKIRPLQMTNADLDGFLVEHGKSRTAWLCNRTGSAAKVRVGKQSLRLAPYATRTVKLA